MARPTKYKPEYNEQVYKLCLLGATDKELADFFNVSEQTINAWKEKDTEFLESLKRGKDDADYTVADSLYQRAKGYTTSEDRILDGGVVTLKKDVPPDTTACIFWLKNRRPKHWRDKQEIGLDTDIKIEYVNVSKDPKYKANA